MIGASMLGSVSGESVLHFCMQFYVLFNNPQGIHVKNNVSVP